MRSYVISTDSSADLSEAYLKEHQITMISLSCILNGETYNSENPITPKQLYDNIREGAMPTTSQVNPEQAKAAFEPLLKEGKDILHLAFSSGLSGSCQSARIAAEELQDEYPERKIVVIDTLLAALGQGLLVYKAVQMKEQGASMDEVICFIFIVEAECQEAVQYLVLWWGSSQSFGSMKKENWK